MKNIIYINLLVIGLTLSCKAQSPIVSLDAPTTTPSGAYLKDLNNELDKFEGTWIFTEGTITFTITLEKKEMVYDGFKYYSDELFGAYSYTTNGVEIVNTFPLITETETDLDNTNIGGNYIIPNNLYVACDDCAPDERRVKLYFSDPERPYLSVSTVLRYIQDGNVPGQDEQITATIFPHGGMLPDENSPSTIRVPYGEYLMVKE
ncbi:hypothetical protein SAMN04487989_101439 [Bizionia echini]|uniref:DUF6705 domain-containing protein n=1 Tax=Bizionia echini TaxID=649333 RepID=A0A1I4Z1L2_9FLAO|nr:DUF6705 family protein [Bizionia echini]SFN44057.1 hypothetical protein SAMN04487989_101439 [Bizionia echini]